MAIYHDLDNTGQEVQQRLDQVPVTQADLAEEVLARQAAVGAVQNNVDAEELRAKAAEKLNADDIDAIEEKIPSGASSSNKMATASDISSLDAAIEAILLLIPSAATSLNKLADKAFVNSSIATATATFRGTKNLVSDLNLAVDATHEQIAVALSEAVSGADNNDYAFVQVPTSSGTPTEIRVTERYKFDGTAWSYEYDLNNSGFTSDQWAAINSTITSGLVDKLNALPSNADLTAALGILTNGIAAINEKIPTAATSSNKLVDTAAMQSYITQILDGIDATFNVTSTDGHVTIQVTQVNGVVTNVAVTTSDIASAADVAQLFQLYNALSQSEPEIIQPADTWPVANPSTTVIYRVIDRVNTPPQNYSDYMFSASDLTTPVLMATYNNAIDPRPKKGSQNLVTSGGVFDNMGALDVSELNATENPHTPAIYADLSAALAAITSDYQKGGMSIKFVQGSVQSNDNKYVQYRYMSSSTAVADFTNVANWQGVDDEPTAGSDNMVKSGGVFNKINELNVILNGEDAPVFSPTITQTGYYITSTGSHGSAAGAMATPNKETLPNHITHIVYTGEYRSAAVALIFYDDSDNVVGYYGGGTGSVVDKSFEIPAGATKFQASSLSSTLLLTPVYEDFDNGLVGKVSELETTVLDIEESITEEVDYTGANVTDEEITSATGITGVYFNRYNNPVGLTLKGVKVKVNDPHGPEHFSAYLYYAHEEGDNVVYDGYVSLGNAANGVNSYTLQTPITLQPKSLLAVGLLDGTTDSRKISYARSSTSSITWMATLFGSTNAALQALAVGTTASFPAPSSVIEGYAAIQMIAVTDEIVILNTDDVVEIVQQQFNTKVVCTNYLYGKVLVSHGDSEVAGQGIGTDNTYPNLIAARNNMTVYNYGHGGWSLVTNLEEMKQCPSGADYITIQIGWNDANNWDASVADDSTDTTTFKGAFNNLLGYYQENFPAAHIVFIVPWYINEPVGTRRTMFEWQKDRCETLNIAYIDINPYSGMRRAVSSLGDLYWMDGIHMKAAGHLRASYMIEAKLREF